MQHKSHNDLDKSRNLDKLKFTFFQLKWNHKLLQHQILPGFFRQHAIGHFSRSLIAEPYQMIVSDKTYVNLTNGFSIHKKANIRTFL